MADLTIGYPDLAPHAGHHLALQQYPSCLTLACTCCDTVLLRLDRPLRRYRVRWRAMFESVLEVVDEADLQHLLRQLVPPSSAASRYVEGSWEGVDSTPLEPDGPPQQIAPPSRSSLFGNVIEVIADTHDGDPVVTLYIDASQLEVATDGRLELILDRQALRTLISAHRRAAR